MKKNRFAALLAAALLAAVWATPLAAQDPPPASGAASAQKTAYLASLLKSIEQTSEQIRRLQDLLAGPSALGREDELRARIAELSASRNRLKATFDQTATEVESFGAGSQEKKELNWNEELTELLGPVISELKKVTARPREIERKRRQIAGLNQQIPLYEKALANIESLLAQAQAEPLASELGQLETRLEAQLSGIRTQKNILERQLSWEESRKKSLTQNLEDIFRIFFRSRGRNLAVSFLVGFLVWFGIRWLHRIAQRLSPFHQEVPTLWVRLFDLTVIFFGIFLSFLTFLATLYFFGDWLLLSIAVFFLVGLAWASKQFAPLVFNQAKLILNFGPVREGERLVYQGVPYRVSRLNLYSELTNGLLKGGVIRLPVRDLVDMRSRPAASDEPWFPTRRGDWVLMPDGAYGEVEIQTPELVWLRLYDGGRKNYPTRLFLESNPMNLSRGFRLLLNFGLGLANEPLVTAKIPDVFEAELLAGLARQVPPESLEFVLVEFDRVGEYGLELAAHIGLGEGLGHRYLELRRAAMRLMLDTAGKRGWRISARTMQLSLAGEPRPGQGQAG